jgi:RNA-binding protein
MAELTGKQRRYLRGLANQIPATVYAGKEGITDSVIRSLEEAYHTRELVKIRLEKACPLERGEAGRELAERTGSHLVQILGRTVLLYRADPEQPRLTLPD